MKPISCLFRKSQVSLVFLLVFVVLGQSALAKISCQQVKPITGHYLRSHYSVHTMSEDLSQKTLSNYIRAWDPGKMYFLQKDIDDFTAKFSKSLAKDIENGNCAAADIIYSLYSKRFEELQPTILKFVASKHNFSIDEYMDIDRRNMPYSSTIEDIHDRWRKRVKFQHLQLLRSIDLRAGDNDAKVREKLKKRYELALKSQKEMSEDEVYGTFLDSFATALDPHSDYFSPSQLQEFRISTSLSLEGIGALLRSEDGVTTIQSLVPGGAAQKSGKLKVEDKIVSVAQGKNTPVDVIDMDLKDVVKLIRGTGGTTVTLTIRRGTEQLVVPIVREKVELADRAAKGNVYHVNGKEDKVIDKYKIGVIDLPSFYMDFEGRQAKQTDFKSSSRDMKEEIIKLKNAKVDAIVVDLRANGGGSLDEAINVAGLFNGPGPVVQIKAANAPPFVQKYEGEALYSGPLVLLVDRQSASASEILAKAIKDANRGIIVGDTHTFGKGTVQNLSDLDASLGAIKVTISKFYGPKGESTQLRGVESDIVLPSISDYYEIGEKHYEYALPFETIPAANIKNFDLVGGKVSELKLASFDRVRRDKEFAEIFKVIDLYKNSKADRGRVSLKEPTKKEKDEEAKAKKVAEEREKSMKKDFYGNVIPQLRDDAILQETVRIAADYVRLFESKKLVDLQIAELAPQAQTTKSKTAAKAKVEPAKERKPIIDSTLVK